MEALKFLSKKIFRIAELLAILFSLLVFMAALVTFNSLQIGIFAFFIYFGILNVITFYLGARFGTERGLQL